MLKKKDLFWRKQLVAFELCTNCNLRFLCSKRFESSISPYDAIMIKNDNDAILRYIKIAIEKKTVQTFRSSSVIFSALRALRHSTLCDPCLRKNSIESNPRPSEETNMAELMRLRLQRSAITVDGSSGCQPWWTCYKYIMRTFYDY